MRWVDGTVFYIVNVTHHSKFSMYETVCAFLVIHDHEKPVKQTVKIGTCSHEWCDGFLCERRVQSKHSAPSLPVKFPKRNESFDALRQSHPSLVMCPAGHMVHAFLACDAQSSCGVNQSLGRCQVVTMDFRMKHTDYRHGRTLQGESRDTESKPEGNTLMSVDMFQCHEYGGTIPYTLVCDFREDCVDRSDETFCRHREDESMFR